MYRLRMLGFRHRTWFNLTLDPSQDPKPKITLLRGHYTIYNFHFVWIHNKAKSLAHSFRIINIMYALSSSKINLENIDLEPGCPLHLVITGSMVSPVPCCMERSCGNHPTITHLSQSPKHIQ